MKTKQIENPNRFRKMLCNNGWHIPMMHHSRMMIVCANQKCNKMLRETYGMYEEDMTAARKRTNRYVLATLAFVVILIGLFKW